MHAKIWEVWIYENLFPVEAAKHYSEFIGVSKLVTKQI